MARIQIHELSPAEAPMEELSYDAAGNITGGGNLDLGALLEILDVVAAIVDVVGLIKDLK